MSQSEISAAAQKRAGQKTEDLQDARAAAKKPSGTKSASQKSSETKAAAKKPSGAKSAAKKQAGGKPSGAGGRKQAGGRQAEPADKKAKRAGNAKSAETGSAGSRMEKRDAERARKREERRRKVRRQKIMIAVLSGVIVAAVIVLILFLTPSLRLSRSLAKGDRYAKEEEYDSAEEAYGKALEIDPLSVQAYRGMADSYLAQGRVAETEQILREGWEQTQDEDLLHYYCVEVYNEAVGEINAGTCTFATADKCVQVLELEPDNADALETLCTHCYEKIFGVEEEDGTCDLFYDEDAAQESCSYDGYEALVERLFALYQKNQAAGIKDALLRYALPETPWLRISMPHVEQYEALLTEINDVLNDAGIAETLNCLARAKEIREYFAPAFTAFEAGDYSYARELVSSGSYQKIRDEFINESSGYWEGSVYIPVNRELLALHREEGKVTFLFPGHEDFRSQYGIITVWGTKQEDDGIQRSAISYVPVGENGETDTEYTIQYLYSNVKIDGKYVPQMNFRFDTKVTTADGITTNAIGDWGGEHEWEIDY